MDENTSKKNIISLIIIVIIIATLAIGTFAWLNSRLDATRLVLTLGDKDGLTVSLSPYKIEATLSPVSSYLDGEVIEVVADNQSSLDTGFNLYYEISEISQALQSSSFRYKIEKSTDNGTTYTEDETGDFTSAVIGTNFDIYEDLVPGNTTYKYKVYIWIQELNEDQSSLQGTTFNGNLMASISDAVKLPLAPVLDNAMIPVTIANDGTVTVVSPRSDSWYNYDTKEWANAVLVTDTNRATYKEASKNDTPNVTIPSTDILAYYVWIPRYSYKIWTTDNTSQTGNEQSIEIKFVDLNTKETGTTVDSFRTHPAFTFDNTELAGIWVGKFELSHNTLSSSTTNNNLGCTTETCANADGLRIIPNVTSLRYNAISQFHYAVRSMSRTNNAFGLTDSGNTNTHVIKNSEWGAVAYLAHSIYGINTEIRLNNNSGYKSGCGANAANAASASACQIQYGNVTTYPQSTTGNITGIFDMAGNAGEYTMGNFDNTNKGGFSNLPEGKYYDVYTSATCTVAMCGGHALNETAGWYGDTIEFVTSSNPWFLRGGTYQDKEATGIFFYQAKDGTASLFRGTKAVMAVFAPDTEKASSITGVPSVSVKYTSNDNAYTSGTWTNENIYVSLSITSQDIGVSKFQYSTNGGTRWNDLTCTKSNGVQVSNNIYTCQENWTTNGSNTLIFRAVDASSGYTNASTLVNIKYDNEGPTGSIDTLLSGTVLTATANASDPSSGVVNQYYFKVLTTDTCGVGTEGTTNFIDNEDSNVYSFSVEQETTYYICARVSDNVGNIAYISETRYVSNKAYLKVLSDDLDFKESTYANKINKLDIVNYIDLSESVANFNLTNDGTNTITAWLINNTQNASNYDLYIGSDYKIYATNLSHAFTNLSYVKNVNIDALFTDEATDMSWMFWNFGKYANITDWSLNLGNNFNTSKVTNMNGMFGLFCEYSSNCSINLGNHFNTINVTDMSWMFRYSGISDSNLKLGDHFNTSNVTNMSEMFYGIHGATDTFNLNLGNHFNTIKVKDMSWMFAYTGYSVVNWNLNFGNYFNTSNVTDMQSMFRNAGYNAANFSLLLDNNFNTSKVKNMSHLFVDAGYNATNWSLNLGNKFITTNVTDMSGMFAQIGGESTNFSLLLDNNFNTSKVTDMAAMFAGIGRNAIDLDLNLGNHFDTSNVTDMAYMFSNFGLETTNWYLNLGNKFNTSNVTNMLGMFDCAGINSVNFNFYLGNNFDANKASFKISMFRNVGRNATNFNLDLGNKFGTIRYANNMFMNAGQNATNFNLSLGNNFNMSNVSYGENLFFNAGYSTTTPFILDLSGGNIKVDIFTTGPGYKGMFNGFGNNMATIYVKDATAQNWIISKNSYWGTNFSASNVLIK